MASWLSSFFQPEFEGKALQRNGKISKEQLLQFFQHGKVLFENPEFKMALAMGHQQGRSVQDLVNQAQMRIWEDKVNPAVQGDYGIQSLSRVLQQYQGDAEFLNAFYEFVHLEEKALDEAEMPASEFEAKYQKLAQLKSAMEAQMKEHEDKMTGMSQEERQKYMAEVYKTMVDMGLGMSGPPACSRSGACGVHNGACSSGPTQPAGPTIAPPAPVEEPAKALAGGVPGLPARPGPKASAMSEEEQLAFFSSLQRSGGGVGGSSS